MANLAIAEYIAERRRLLEAAIPAPWFKDSCGDIFHEGKIIVEDEGDPGHYEVIMSSRGWRGEEDPNVNLVVDARNNMGRVVDMLEKAITRIRCTCDNDSHYSGWTGPCADCEMFKALEKMVNQ